MRGMQGYGHSRTPKVSLSGESNSSFRMKHVSNRTGPYGASTSARCIIKRHDGVLTDCRRSKGTS